MEIRRDRTIGCACARRATVLLPVLLMSAALTGCGGDSDSAPAAAAPTPAAPPAAAAASESLTGASFAQGTTTLSWTPPTTNEDGTPLTLTGYKIYWGDTEDNYPHSVTVANPGLTRYVVEQLPANTWYFVATALSADGESPPSNVVRMQIL